MCDLYRWVVRKTDVLGSPTVLYRLSNWNSPAPVNFLTLSGLKLTYPNTQLAVL